MATRLLQIVFLAAVAYAAVWALRSTEVHAGEGLRSLAEYRVEALPEELPPEWGALLASRLAGAPEVSLLDPRARGAARELIGSVPWIDPDSVHVELDHPHGLRVSFEPRRPRLRLFRQGVAIALLDPEGTVLPAGVPRHYLELMAGVHLDGDGVLPPPGRRVADALVQEALATLDEFYALRERTGLDLWSMARQSDFPASARAVAPPLSFLLGDGTVLEWGRSRAWRDPLLPALDVEQKTLRLEAVLAAHPGLQGVGRVVLDGPLLRVYGLRGEPLPAPESTP
ncbi:MAG TPA: hypothetical protein VGC54_05060 [Planctomycetota bacterium]